MKIIGINLSHDFSICVYENNELKDIWYEERFNEIKKWKIKTREDFNYHLISLLNKVNFKPDLVCYSAFFRKNIYKYTDYDIINQIQKQLDNPNYFFNIHNHHIYHALCAFYFSSFEETMSIVIDGGGAQPFDDAYQEMESIFYLNKKFIFPLYQHLSNRRFTRCTTETLNYSNYGVKEYLNGTEYLFSSKASGGYLF
jgi:predicted NodU family carbamoyl transferase